MVPLVAGLGASLLGEVVGMAVGGAMSGGTDVNTPPMPKEGAEEGSFQF